MIQPRLILAALAMTMIGTGYKMQAAPTQQNGASEHSATRMAAAVKPLFQMSPAEIDKWLPSLKAMSLPQRMQAVSARAIDTPYFLGPLGEGPNAPFDKKPLMDLSRVDCVTFCEQTLALSMSSSYKQAYEVLQKIRYKGGQKPSERLMETRNHYFMADWVPNNRWLVSDVTPSLPGHQPLTRTISHKQLFASQNFTGIQVREPDRNVTIQYIPDTKLQGLEKQLKSGDIGVLIQDHPGIFAAHTGMMFKLTDGRWVFRNATSLEPKKVVDTPWPTLIEALQKSKRLIGMTFVRPRQP
ncbi:MAG: N-acetylmuramoyl-L-alanine amidase-like domain-containing protein [Candidatus Sericytochromatia bacterium]